MKLSRFHISGGLLIVLTAYCSIYLSLLSFSSFLPYAMDNNETWCNLGHAKNVCDYGISKNKGLADEACEYSAQNPNAHPLVHTHQGNFPRLWATLLYFIGFQTAREQIAITTFTIGILSLLAAFGFIRRVLGETVAVLFCLFMMTDYLLFAQWQVNTWRVWQGLYFFGALYLVHRISREGGRLDRWILLTLLFFAIFYSELVFASFIWSTAIVYAAILCWRGQKRTLLKITTVAIAGGILAGVVLVSQLIAYYGYQAMFRDAYYTVTLRNIVSDPKKLAEAIQFMQEKDILFLRNFASNPGIHSINWLFRSIFRGIVGPWSPMFFILATLGFSGLLIHWVANNRPMQFFRDEFIKLACLYPTVSARVNADSSFSKFFAFIRNPLVLGGVWMGWCVLLVSVLKDYWFWTGFGRSYVGVSLIIPLVIFVATLLTWASLRFNYDTSKNPAKTGYLIAVTVVLVITAFVISRYPTPFPSEYKSIWDLVLMSKFFPLMLMLGILGGGMYLVAHVFIAGDPRFTVLGEKFGAAFPLLAAASISYLVAWLWSPGYLMTGYLNRCCPIVTYAMYLIPALALWAYGFSARVWYSGILRPALLWTSPGLSCAAGAAIVAGIGMLAFWIRVQAVSIELLPPSLGRLMGTLESTIFQGKGLAVSNYTVPAAFSAKSWGWNSSNWNENMAKHIPPAPIQWDPDNLWIAEKAKTSEYAKPEFYVFYDPPYSMDFAVKRARILLGREKADPRYLDSSIVRSAMGLEPSPFQHQLVCKDQSRWEAWVIVKLDQRPIPYLGQDHPVQPVSSSQISHPPVSGKKPSARWPVYAEFVPNSDILVLGKPILQILSPEETPMLFHARKRALNPGAENAVSSFAVVATGVIFASPNSSLEFVFNEDVPSGTLYVWQGEQLRVFSRDNEKSASSNNRIVLQAKNESTAMPDRMPNQEVPQPAHVRLASQIVGRNELVVSPIYTYLHSGKVSEGDSHWKLWSVKNGGVLSLVSETTNREAFHVHHNGIETLILSVIPKDANGRSGFEYFSAPFDLGNR